MLFFFYGTLIAGSGNRVATAAHALLRDLGPATTAGTIHAIADPAGWYPALLPGAGTVHGRLYQAGSRFDGEALAALDAYEDFDPADPASSLYLRETICVAREDRSRCEADAYRFNQPLPATAQAIDDGDFANWLARHGYAAFGGG